MPEATQSMPGFTPIAAIVQLLKLRGFQGPSQSFQETHGVAGSLESLVYALEVEGIQARLAIVQPDEMRYLGMPTLLQFKNGSWAILLKWGRRGVQLETPSGIHWFSHGKLEHLLNGQVLDLSLSLPRGKTLWARVNRLIGLQKGALVHLISASLMLQLLSLIMPELTSVVMNRTLSDNAGSMLQLVASGMLLVAAFQTWTGWIREQALLYLMTRIEISVERGFLEHLLRLPFPYLQTKTLGDLLQAFGGLTNARELLAERAIGTILDGAMASIFLLAMGYKLFVPTMVVVLVAIAMASGAVIAGHAQAKVQILEVRAQADERGYLTELIEGIGTIKAAGAESHGLIKWLNRFQQELGFSLRKNRLGLWSEVGLTTMRQAILVGLLIWGGKSAIKGEVDIGTLFAFLQLSIGFLAAGAGVVDTYLTMVMLRPQLAKAEEFLAVEPETFMAPWKDDSRMLCGPVLMEDVWFRYTPNGPWVLKGYNLRVEAGETLQLTGPSGSGKSTILRLLAGLYTPQMGAISIGGMSSRAARNEILYLPQFVHLYGGTILENLQLLSGGATLDRLIEVSKQTKLDELIASFPHGYKTILPPGGRSLSGGQRQLIAVTAMLASNKSVMILDEAMANLDTILSSELEQLIKERPWTKIVSLHNVGEKKIQKVRQGQVGKIQRSFEHVLKISMPE